MPESSDSPLRRFEKALKNHHCGKSDEAIAELREITSNHPTFEDAYEAASVILYERKRYDEAIQILKEWLRVNPTAVMCRTNLSRCYVAKGMILEAEKEQTEARRLSWMAELKAKKQSAPERNFDEEISRYKQVIQLDPKDVLGYFTLGRVYIEAGKKREAADILEKAVEVGPAHSASYLAYGEALQLLGDNQKARKIYTLGMRAADEAGDLMTLKKMQSRLNALTKTENGSNQT